LTQPIQTLPWCKFFKFHATKGKIRQLKPVLDIKSFGWFSEDFNEDALGFYLQYAEGQLKEKLIRNKDRIQVKYLHYDWSLNDIKAEPSQKSTMETDA
jgi:hypothetical protein